MTAAPARDQAPLVTIGMCCYNSADTVGRAIDSALRQDWPNFELLIVDDGSSDETVNVIADKIKGHANARLIRHEKNKTFPGALNTVIREAKGAFIAIFDDDDESAPERLSVQYRTITDYEAKTGATLVACWGSVARKYPNDYTFSFQAIGSQPEVPIGTTVIDYILFYGKKPGVFYGGGTPSCALMLRKSTYEQVGPYDETMFRSEDADFSIRLALKGGHFIGCKEQVVTQYSTGGAEKRADVTYNSYRLLMTKYKDYLTQNKRYDYAMTWNKLRLYHFSRQRLKACGILFILFLKYPLWTWQHFWSTAPARLLHEFKMNKKAAAQQ